MLSDDSAVRRLAAIVESSDDAIIGKDLDGIVTSWNRAAERIFGYRADEMIGRSIRVLIPADRQSEEDHVLSRIRQGLAVEHFETLRVRKDGSLVPISLTVSPVRTARGDLIGASKIARDITERKRLAEQAAFLAEAGAVLSSSLDYDATLTAVARLAVPIIADGCAVDVVRDDGEIARLAVEQIDPPPGGGAWLDDPELRKCVTEVMANGGSSLSGPAFGVTSSLCVALVARGRTFGALTFVTGSARRGYTEHDLRFAQDVAYRAALAIDNAQAYDQARRANQLKDEFLATLSHELRTPLNAILGYTRMLRAGILTDDRQQQALDTVERNATVLARIVEDVLDVSRIISGKIALQVQPVELGELTREAMQTVLAAAEAKGLRMQLDVDGPIPAMMGDPDRLQQVIWNLLSNAVKFTPAGGEVRVRIARTATDVEITVTDSGVGIPPEFLAHVFERFRQADGSLTRERGGLGLGLAIARHLVELHGGTIDAASAGRNRGSTFSVRLPQTGTAARQAPSSSMRSGA